MFTSFPSLGSIGELTVAFVASAAPMPQSRIQGCSSQAHSRKMQPRPTKGLEESELLSLAANKDLSFSYTGKPVVPAPNPDGMVEPTPAGPKLPVPRTTSRGSTQVSLNSLVTLEMRCLSPSLSLSLCTYVIDWPS
ncbi:thioredoxin-like 1-2, chloroplastic [Iris pallida]|uniref:Thioredoxin-like 1-2, chloroplastic n=1 Tax=Iris pallida TaxID=29817 RepID=A0AAX6I396_IRIPA|nr:thioredoxin-like 1-2, chloroplastic [Iris pallida]